MERRPVSEPTEWQCPECGAWWDVDPKTSPEIAPSYDFETKEAILDARWVRRDDQSA